MGGALLLLLTPIEWYFIGVGLVFGMTMIFFMAYWVWLGWIREESKEDSKKMARLFKDIDGKR